MASCDLARHAHAVHDRTRRLHVRVPRVYWAFCCKKNRLHERSTSPSYEFSTPAPPSRPRHRAPRKNGYLAWIAAPQKMMERGSEHASEFLDSRRIALMHRAAIRVEAVFRGWSARKRMWKQREWQMRTRNQNVMLGQGGQTRQAHAIEMAAERRRMELEQVAES